MTVMGEQVSNFDRPQGASNPLCPKTERERDQALAELERVRDRFNSLQRAVVEKNGLIVEWQAASRDKNAENKALRASLTDLLTAARHLLDCSQASEPQECPDCDGCGKMGANNHPDEAPCPACHGTGKTEPFEVEALRALERAVNRLED